MPVSFLRRFIILVPFAYTVFTVFKLIELPRHNIIVTIGVKPCKPKINPQPFWLRTYSFISHLILDFLYAACQHQRTERRVKKVQNQEYNIRICTLCVTLITVLYRLLIFQTENTQAFAPRRLHPRAY